MTFTVKPGMPDQKWNRVLIFGLAGGRDMGKGRGVIPGEGRILLPCMDFSSHLQKGELHWKMYAAGKSRKYGDPAWMGFDPVHEHMVTARRPAFDYKPDEAYTLRVARVGDWAEATINGRRLALVPVSPKLNDPVLYLRMIGTKADVTRLRADVLE